MQLVRAASLLVSSLALVIASLASSTVAQTTQQPLEEFTRPQEAGRDPFGSRNGGAGFFDLIHRANLGGLKNSAEFRQEQRQNIDNAAADFRARQLELLRQQTTQPAASTGEPTVVPASSN
ncbi:MAG: hypothetical protein NZ772_10250 [Cyanobacteria bacterium]|nr:hypothetical protein [Cyanobacteriota bacterium]MDW8201837.1 hypothetical protein [Cyanobacteriota bacterium SKYGB_h_bin112]